MKKPSKAHKEKELTLEEWKERHLCRYETEGQRCQLVGDMSTQTSGSGDFTYYCQWHFINLSDPGMAQNFEEFTNWRLKKRETYASIRDNKVLWAEHELVWQAVRGEIEHEIFAKKINPLISVDPHQADKEGAGEFDVSAAARELGNQLDMDTQLAAEDDLPF